MITMQFLLNLFTRGLEGKLTKVLSAFTKAEKALDDIIAIADGAVVSYTMAEEATASALKVKLEKAEEDYLKKRVKAETAAAIDIDKIIAQKKQADAIAIKARRSAVAIKSLIDPDSVPQANE